MYYLYYEKINYYKENWIVYLINYVFENISCLFFEYIVFFEGGMGYLLILIWLKVN